MGDEKMTGQRVVVAILACALLASAGAAAGQDKPAPGFKAGGAGPLDRSVLPIPAPKRPQVTEPDVRKAKAPAFFQVKAPAGAPNVVIVLLDDMGFGQPSTFGGGVSMPTLDRLANEGLRYNNFHTAAL